MATQNQTIIDRLEQLLILYKRDPSLKFKCKALSTAIPLLKTYESKIECGAQAMNDIKGIGKGIAERIDEILQTGTLAELGINDEKYYVIDELKSITGVGDVRAEKWYQMGIRSVDDVRNAVAEGKITITHHIQLGLKYYEHMKERIPRAEIEKIEKKIQKLLNGTGILYQICGSYRRGQHNSGDIDLLISHPDCGNCHQVISLRMIVDMFTKAGLLIDHLTEDGDTKYMGFCALNKKSKARRIDIRVIPYVSYYAAILYFTGSQQFNIQMRNRALAMGMSLNEYGLTHIESKERIFLKSEEEIFSLLQIPYKNPYERNL